MALVKKENTATNLHELEYAVDKAVFEAEVQAAYKKNVGKFNIPGFRKGKAPRHLIEKMYGKGVFYEDAVNACIPDAYEAAVKEAELDVVGKPEFDIASIGDENGLVLKIKVYTKPEVTLTDYFGMEAEKPSKTVTDEEVDAEVKRAREKNARTVEVTDRAAEMEDTVNFDFKGFVDDVAFEGGEATGHELKLGSGAFIPGFEEQIVGKTIGEEFDVNVTFPEEYHAENLKGKPAVFKCKLNGIKKTELPELDDEFVKDVTENLNTVDEYLADVREKLQKRYDEEAESVFETNIYEALISHMTADIPETMFDTECENQIDDFANRLRMQGMDINTYFQYTGLNMEAMKQQVRPRAEKQVKIRLALEKLVELENVTVTDEDVEKEYADIAAAYTMEVEKVKELVKRESIEADMKVKAAFDLLKSKSVAVAPKEEAKEEN